LFLGKSQKIYIASSHADGNLKRGWGSTRALDESIKFASVSVVHDGHEKTRQDKTKDIVNYIKSNNLNKVELRVCTHRNSEGENCSVCEKCLRSAIGLYIEGEDPKDWGFKYNGLESLKIFKSKLSLYRFRLAENIVDMWQQIQKNIDLNKFNGNEKKLLLWLKKINFTILEKRYSYLSGRQLYSMCPVFIRRIIRKMYFMLRHNK
jgi:hypothetical protein